MGGISVRNGRHALAVTASEPKIWPAETTQDADLRTVLAHWEKLRSARGDGPMPLRAVASAEIGRLLKFMYLCDVMDGGRDFRWRIVGAGVFPNLGSLTGKLVSQHPDAGVRLRFPIMMRAAIAAKKPVRGTALRETLAGGRELESIWLPFGDASVQQVLGMVAFYAAGARALSLSGEALAGEDALCP